MKKETYKRGDQVLFMRLTDYGLTIQQAQVTATKGEAVYVKHSQDGGYEWKNSFSPDGNFYRNSYPLWALRKLKPTDSLKNLTKRSQRVSDAYRSYKDKWSEMEREVERLAWEFKKAELAKRKETIPGGWPDMVKAAARMGFKQPKK